MMISIDRSNCIDKSHRKLIACELKVIMYFFFHIKIGKLLLIMLDYLMLNSILKMLISSLSIALVSLMNCLSFFVPTEAFTSPAEHSSP